MEQSSPRDQEWIDVISDSPVAAVISKKCDPALNADYYLFLKIAKLQKLHPTKRFAFLPLTASNVCGVMTVESFLAVEVGDDAPKPVKRPPPRVAPPPPPPHRGD